WAPPGTWRTRPFSSTRMRPSSSVARRCQWTVPRPPASARTNKQACRMSQSNDLPTTSLSAVWYGTGDLRLEERPLPLLGAQDVLVEIVGCGVCATDRQLLDGGLGL